MKHLIEPFVRKMVLMVGDDRQEINVVFNAIIHDNYSPRRYGLLGVLHQLAVGGHPVTC